MRTLFTSVAWPRGRKPKRAHILDKAKERIDWGKMERCIQPDYPVKPTTGRPPYPLKTMLRVFFLQWIFDLSDEATEDLVLDSHSAALFCELDPWKPRPPGATAIRNFRHFMRANKSALDPFIYFRQELSVISSLKTGVINEPVIHYRRQQ